MRARHATFQDSMLAFGAALSMLAGAGCSMRSGESVTASMQSRIGFPPVVLAEIGPGGQSLDFDDDGVQDVLQVIRQPVGPTGPAVDLAAFGYGPSEGPDARCLLAAVAREPAQAPFSGAKALCGASSILVLQAGLPIGPPVGHVTRASRAQVLEALGSDADLEPLGDGVVLQTQAAEILLFFTRQGFVWTETSAGE